MDPATTEEQLLSEIRRLNEDPNCHGIILQASLPLPLHASYVDTNYKCGYKYNVRNTGPQ